MTTVAESAATVHENKLAGERNAEEAITAATPDAMTPTTDGGAMHAQQSIDGAAAAATSDVTIGATTGDATDTRADGTAVPANDVRRADHTDAAQQPYPETSSAKGVIQRTNEPNSTSGNSDSAITNDAGTSLSTAKGPNADNNSTNLPATVNESNGGSTNVNESMVQNSVGVEGKSNVIAKKVDSNDSDSASGADESQPVVASDADHVEDTDVVVDGDTFLPTTRVVIDGDGMTDAVVDEKKSQQQPPPPIDSAAAPVSPAAAETFNTTAAAAVATTTATEADASSFETNERPALSDGGQSSESPSTVTTATASTTDATNDSDGDVAPPKEVDEKSGSNDVVEVPETDNTTAGNENGGALVSTRELLANADESKTDSIVTNATHEEHRDEDGVVTTTQQPAAPAGGTVTKSTSATAVESTAPLSASAIASIMSLPMDSLHSIASFLTPPEWSEFGRTSRAGRRICHEIIRRVRMHGYRCATEVVTAWKLGQHADAKELSALYIQAGVPIYPTSLGHSYHTLLWRMDVEAKEIEDKELFAADEERAAAAETGSLTTTATTRHGGEVSEVAAAAAATATLTPPPGVVLKPSPTNLDPFYRERSEFRGRENYGDQVTYVAEKCLFWLDKQAAAKNGGNNPLATPGNNAGAAGGAFLRALRTSNHRVPSPVSELLSSVTSATSGTSDAALRNKSASLSSPHFKPKLPIKVHQHLLHQHNLGRDFVHDGDGGMVTPPVNLSVDFFHPNARQFASSAARRRDAAFNSGAAAAPADGPPGVPGLNVLDDAQPFAGDEIRGLVAAPGTRLVGDVAVPPLLPDAAALNHEAEELARALPGFLDEQELDMDNHDALFEPTVPILKSKLNAILAGVDLEVYCSSFSGDDKKAETADGIKELKRHLRSRFATYQRRLEAFLTHSDHTGFEECILDFWDEFFPHTTGIHYYDRHTPVPRISCLQKFLTKPCPKSIGIVQCEIERLKITSKGKGVNMKGRLFPTYEYRLFIRNRPQNADTATNVGDDDPPSIRRDTVLMVAKNRGRKHTELSGVVPASVSMKKGANNYYLYMPKQEDVDDHFNKVNELEVPVNMNPNGASNDAVLTSDAKGAVLLGRLQSNFIGTEFQIFTPHLKKRPRHKISDSQTSHCMQLSEDELDYDSGMSSDNTTSRRSRFGRLSLRRGSNTDNTEGAQQQNSSGRHTRPNRRAIAANTPDSQQQQQQQQSRQPSEPRLYEVEDGAITYTANLLGSRPRIMDVCIPKVTFDGVAGTEWKRYLDTCDDTDESSMLNCFRILQQRLNEEQMGTPADEHHQQPGQHQQINRGSEADMNDHEGHNEANTDFGLMALQNRPPWWNIELGSFVLNFGGRVSVASVKNFQLCDRHDHDRIMLQFGRIQGRHSFTMDYQHPLTAVQAFSIAISSLQSKISFG